MFTIQINSTSFRYSSDGQLSFISVTFPGNDPENEINLSGAISISPEEYKGNEAPELLQNVIKEKVIERLEIEAE